MCQKYIKILQLKYKLGQIGPKIKVSLNLHENSHTSQFEDSEYEYDMIRGFLNSTIQTCEIDM